MNTLLQDIVQSVAALNKGGTILYPTDTIWGIGCDATNIQAVEKVYQTKQRALEKSCIILVPSLRSLMSYIAIPPLDLDDIVAAFDDYPTTFIIHHAIGLADNLVAADGSIAFRIPKDDFCIQLLKKLGKPIVSTSANISGQTAPASFQEIDLQIKAAVDYIVLHRQKETQKKAASRIIMIGEDGSLKTIRDQ